MQITVFGASGKIGSRVVELALQRGYRVIAFVHTRDLFVPDNNLVVLKGDVYNAEDVRKAVQGSQAVISCLSSWGTERKNVLEEAMRAIIPAMEEQNSVRLVTLTGSAALTNGDVPPPSEKLVHAVASLLAGKILRDAEAHIRLLQASNLDWTVIRSPIMNNIGGPGYRLSLKLPGLATTISREAVATCLLDQLETGRYLRQSPVIYRA